MWSQKPVCGLFANNMVSLAAIVGPTSRVFAVNVGRQGLLFVGELAEIVGRYRYGCAGPRWKPLAGQGHGAARVVLHGLDHLSRYIAGVQVGITLAGLASGLFGEPALAALMDPVGAVLFPPALPGPQASTALSTGLTLLVITYLAQ